MKSIALAAAATMMAAPSLGATWAVNGFQATAGFEDSDVGDTSSCDELWKQCVSGGVVSEAGGAFTARTGARFMLGTSIETPQYEVGVTLWPALAAWIQGASVVTITFWGGQFGDLELIGTLQTAGGGEYEFVEFLNPGFDVPLLEMRMSSATPFAMDDVTFGLTGQMPGVPESATWALMIIGFGAVGLAARRQTAPA